MSERRPLERTYLVVDSAGRHATVAQRGEPNERRLNDSATYLDRMGRAGWLVLSETGSEESFGAISLLPIRRITVTDGDWNLAAAEFQRMHAERMRVWRARMTN